MEKADPLILKRKQPLKRQKNKCLLIKGKMKFETVSGQTADGFRIKMVKLAALWSQPFYFPLTAAFQRILQPVV